MLRARCRDLLTRVCHGLTHVIPYVDDIIIFSANEDDHLMHLQELFERLDQYGIVINPTKSLYGQPELTFFGHTVCKEGVKPTKEKVDAILRYPQPSTVKQLRRYLGMVQYYHRFIPHVADILAPLNDLLKGSTVKSNKQLVWHDDAQQAFCNNKRLLADATLLVCPVPNASVAVFADASDLGIDGVLQVQIEGVWSPVAFFSRRLNH